MKKEKNYFTIRKLSIYTIKRIWAESPKCARWKSKEKAQLTVLCRDLKLMSQHKLVLIAHDQSRPLFLSAPTVLMSQPQFHVVTSLSSYSSNVCVATSVLGSDHVFFVRRLHVVTLISWSQFCWWFSCLHNFQFYVVTSW